MPGAATKCLKIAHRVRIGRDHVENVAILHASQNPFAAQNGYRTAQAGGVEFLGVVGHSRHYMHSLKQGESQCSKLISWSHGNRLAGFVILVFDQ